MSEIAISVRNLVKRFRVYESSTDLAIEVITGRNRHRSFTAIDNVSFEIPKGEVVGIVGSNGAGKSTLLKIITGVLDVTEGLVESRGKISAILELGLGFNPEYSGRENIYLSGLLYGMEREEIDRKLESIIDFSGIRKFIDQPVRTYSSGMHARLAFSIATAVEPEILIIDEALAAGDAGFVQKCLRRLKALCEAGSTVILVSHGTNILAQLCSRVIWLEEGRVKMVGSALEVVRAYDLAAHEAASSGSRVESIENLAEQSERHSPAAIFGKDVADASIANQVFRRGPVSIEGIDILDDQGRRSTNLVLLKPFSIKIRYKTEGAIPDSTLGISIALNQALDLAPVMQWYTQNIRPDESRSDYLKSRLRVKAVKLGEIELQFPYMPFRAGEYLLSVGLLPNEPGNWEFYEYRHLFYSISVTDSGFGLGAPFIFEPKVTFSEREKDKITSNEARREVDVKETAHPIPVAPSISPLKDRSRISSPVKTLRSEIEKICFVEGKYPQGWPTHQNCPACGDGELRFAFSKYGIRQDRCLKCGFLCVNPYPPQAVIEKIYDGAYYTALREFLELPNALKGGRNSPFSVPVEILQPLVEEVIAKKPAGSWLDVGGGIGTFASFVRSVAPNWKVYLNELNERSVELAREVYNLEVLPKSAEALADDGLTFDVISAVAVLEHIADPKGFIEAYLKILKPGGFFVLVLPQFTKLNAELSRTSSGNSVPPFHLSLFNIENFSRMLKRIGALSIVAVKQAGPAAFSLEEIADYGDHWDVSVPTEDQPIPQAIRLKDYGAGQSRLIEALSEIREKFQEHFAETDGRLYLAAIVQRS